MKVLVTGGAGFIGSYVCEDLYDYGHDPLVLDTHGGPAQRPWETLLGDIRDRTAVTEAMAHSDAWIHLAGVLGTQETILNPWPAAETNILGGINVLEAAAQYKLPGVCIAVGNHWMNNTYSITKTTIERFCDMYRRERGLPVTVVRALNAYGPRQSVAAPYGTSKVRKIMPAFICRALTGAPIEVYGDGTQVMDMIHVNDVARVLTDALNYTAENGGADHILEAGTGRRTTVNDIAEAVAFNVPGTEVTHVPMRPGEPDHSVVLGDPATLEFMGPRYLTTLEDGVRDTVEWFRENWLPTYA